MRAIWVKALLLLGAAAVAAVAFAVAAAPHGGPEARTAPLRMPVDTGPAVVVDARPAPSRSESRPKRAARPQATPEAAKPGLRPKPRVRVVTVPGVVLTRSEPTEPERKLVRAKAKRRSAATRELASQPDAEPMHDSRPYPHE
jgi:hypothetical protein